MKNNEKGFTLVELLAVIAILLLIVAIAVPSISSLRNRSYNKVNQTQIKEFESLAKSLASNYNTSLSSTTDCYFLTLEDMVNKKILDEIPTDANGDQFSNTSGVRICGGSTITYEYDTEKSDTDKDFSELSPNTVVYDEYSIPGTSGDSTSGDTKSKLYITGLVPTSVTDGDSILSLGNDVAFKKSFIVKKSNSSNPDYYVRIDLTDLEVSYQYKSYDIKWAVFEETTPIHTGSFIVTNDGSTSINLATNIEIGDTEKTFTIVVWANSNGDENQANEVLGGSIKGTLVIDGSYDKLNTVESVLRESFSSDTEVDDYTMTNFGFPTYLGMGELYISFGVYKNDVINNFSDDSKTQVASAGDEIKWQVLRINEDGSIRLISYYNRGYDYDTERSVSISSSYNDGKQKSLLEKWYAVNLKEYDTQIQIGDFCERNIYNDNLTTDSNALKDYDKTFICSSDSTMINSKIGMATVDDVFRGSPIFGNRFKNGTEKWCTLTHWRSSIGSNFAAVTSTGIKTLVCYIDSIRPVINLKADSLILTGSGTTDDPYIIG